MGTKILGVDIGATRTSSALLNQESLEQTVDFPTDYNTGEELGEILDREYSNFESIGIGVPGLIDPEEKQVFYAENLAELDLKKTEEILGSPLYVENDANTAVIGEKMFGSGETVENLVAVNIGSGIGSGVYYRGNLLESSGDRRAGESGFITLENDKTWEYYCGGSNIPERYTEFVDERDLEDLVDPESAEEVFEAAKKGDQASERYLEDEWKRHARQGISSIVNVFGPERMILTGSVAVENPGIMQDVFEEVNIKGNTANPVPEMGVTELGKDIGLYGAAGLALERY